MIRVFALVLSLILSYLPNAHSAELKSCPVKLPQGSTYLASMAWSVPKSSDQVTPKGVTFCHFNHKGNRYTLILAKYSNASLARKSIEPLKKTDGYLFFGVPTGFYLDKPLKSIKSSVTLSGIVSTDSCGRFGLELFDTRCPSGKAALFLKADKIYVLSNRFEDKANIKVAPVSLLKEIVKFV